MHFEIHEFLNFQLLLFSLLFAIILLTEKFRSKKIAGILMLAIALLYFFVYIGTESVKTGNRFVIDTNLITYRSFLLSINPLLFLYVKSLTTERFSFNKKQLFHFLPFFLSAFFVLIIISAYYIFNTNIPEKIYVHRELRNTLYSIAYRTQVLIYVPIMWILSIRHIKQINNTFSYKDSKNNLLWLKAFLIIHSIFVFSDLITSTLRQMPVFDGYTILVGYYIFATFYIIFLGCFLIKQKDIYHDSHLSHIKNIINKGQIEEEDKEAIKEESPQALSDTKSKEIYKKIVDLIKKDKLFENPELSIYLLSKKTNINSKYISYAVNKEAGVNFCTFINQFRVDEAKRLLDADRKNRYTLDSLSAIVGFHSYTSFYSWFKKLTGKTPSQYKKDNEKAENEYHIV